MRPTVLLNRYVLLAFVLQVASYAALLGFFEHGDVTPLVAAVRQLPAPVLAVLAPWAVPAVAVTIAVGVALEYALGAQVTQLGAVLLTRGDLLFLVVAYLLSVGVARLVPATRGRLGSIDPR